MVVNFLLIFIFVLNWCQVVYQSAGVSVISSINASYIINEPMTESAGFNCQFSEVGNLPLMYYTPIWSKNDFQSTYTFFSNAL